MRVAELPAVRKTLESWLSCYSRTTLCGDCYGQKLEIGRLLVLPANKEREKESEISCQNFDGYRNSNNNNKGRGKEECKEMEIHPIQFAFK